ncbi:hypothetical protein BHE74_00002389 [Ensete ventricosum]|nr:hypothetical protein GW17_00044840 [Ensete ventricosum]RWW88718.1 hypothetical protein BHE74_00002389 [Ensete ventricosum]RZR79448.1 hypothetical protein BHM03_00005171 [Ensete ventricosum]
MGGAPGLPCRADTKTKGEDRLRLETKIAYLMTKSPFLQLLPFGANLQADDDDAALIARPKRGRRRGSGRASAYGCFAQSMKGEDCFVVRTDCLGVPGDPSSSSVFAVRLRRRFPSLSCSDSPSS